MSELMTVAQQQHPASLLEQLNPLPEDGKLLFYPEPHIYVWETKPVRKSVTKMLKNYWPEFNDKTIIDEQFNTWRTQKHGKYFALIQYLMLVEGHDDAYCKLAISKLWNANRAFAATTGTSMHADLQAIVERWPISHETPEMQRFKDWLRRFCEDNNCAPFRAEWLIVLDSEEIPVVAGQVDLVLKHREKDEYVGIDYKRTDPTAKYKGGPQNILGPTQKSFSGETGKGPFANLEATDFNKYSAQLNAYGHIAATKYGIDFRDRMLLLQIHPQLPQVHAVRVPRLDDEMRVLFSKESANAKHEQLMCDNF
jgi:hypothetical protein